MTEQRQTFPVKIFFDESGKRTEKMHLMGAILIPKSLYNLDEMQELNELIRSTNIHWTEYGGDSIKRKQIEKLILTIMKHQHLINMNVISYNINKIEQESRVIQGDVPSIIDLTIYTKFPERVVYGLIRKYGRHSFVDAEVSIEHDTTYEAKEYDLKKIMIEQLNVQSVYRGENFKLHDVNYLSKKKEYGIELTDLLLGMIRTIVENDTSSSKRKQEKNKLVNRLLSVSPEFKHFIKRVKLYEWGQGRDLVDAPLSNYLNIFMSSHLHQK